MKTIEEKAMELYPHYSGDKSISQTDEWTGNEIQKIKRDYYIHGYKEGKAEANAEWQERIALKEVVDGELKFDLFGSLDKNFEIGRQVERAEWQEKLRWKDFTKELPEIREIGYRIDTIDVFGNEDEVTVLPNETNESILGWVAACYFAHWREIIE